MAALLRSEATFLVGPVLLHLAETRDSLTHGFHLSIVIMLIVTVVAGVLLVIPYHSPPLPARLRKKP